MPEQDESLKKWSSEQTEITELYVHDFKNPITAITANISYLESVFKDADADIRETIADIKAASKLLLHMLDNFLKIAHMENGKKMEPAIAPLSQIIAASVKNCQKLFLSSDINIVVDTASDALCEWPMKYAGLALENLIMSAVANSLDNITVTISASVENKVVKIVIADTGIPVDSEYWDQQFEKSFQIKSKLMEKARYSKAMGLYAVGLAAKHMGGTIQIESDEKSTSAILTLPQNVQ